MLTLQYACLQSIAKQWGINPDQDYSSLTRQLQNLAEEKKWSWRPPKD